MRNESVRDERIFIYDCYKFTKKSHLYAREREIYPFYAKGH